MLSAEGIPSPALSAPQGGSANILDNSSEYYQEILDYCKALPERVRLFVLFRALAWDVPLTALHHLLNAVGIPAGEGGIWTVGTVLREYRSALPPEMVDKGILKPAVLHALACEAMREERIAAGICGQIKTFSLAGTFIPLRAALYGGDSALYEALRCGEGFMLSLTRALQGYHFDQAWYASLSGMVQSDMARAAVEGAATGSLTLPHTADMIKHVQQWPPHDAAPLEQRYFQLFALSAGRFGQLFSAAPGEAEQHTLFCEALLALGHVFAGERAAAQQVYDKNTASLSTMLSTGPGVISRTCLFFLRLGHTLCLLHEDKPATAEKLWFAYAIAEEYAPPSRAMLMLCLHQQGKEAEAWEHAQAVADGVKQKGIPLLRALCVFVLGLCAPDLLRYMGKESIAPVTPQPGVLPLTETLQQIGLAAAFDGTMELPAFLECMSFVHRRKQPWEARLQAALEDVQEFQETGPAQRLLWALDVNKRVVYALVQKSTGSNTWTKGARTRIQEFTGGHSVSWLSEHDRRILLHGFSLSEDYFDFIGGTLEILAGHPHIVDYATRKPLTLRLAQPEMRLLPTEEGCKLLFTPDPATLPQLLPDGPDGYVYVVSSARLRELHKHVGTELTLPQEAVPQVLEVAQRLGKDVRLHSELPTQAQEPDSRVLVRLREEGTTLHLSWGVRPFGLVASPVMEAGQGAQELYHSRGTVLYSVQRDFAAEKAAVEALFHTCPTLTEYRKAPSVPGLGSGFAVEDPQDALRCLLELGEYSAAVLEWQSAGKKSVRRGRLTDVHVALCGDGVWAKATATLQINGGEEDLAALWRGMEMAQGDFVPVGEGEYLALTKDFRHMLQRLQLMAQQDTAGDAALHIPQLAALALEELLQDMDAGTADNTWKGVTERIREAMQYTPVVPEALQTQLLPYQEEGFVWLVRLGRWGAGACLADEMGLGKSVQAIAFLLEQAGQGPALVLAPTSVCGNWEQELCRFAPSLEVRRFSRHPQCLAGDLGPGQVCILSYGEMLHHHRALQEMTWQVAVFDEAQALKNPATQRSKAAAKINARQRVALTGTPIENYLEDLWGIFRVINPGLLGSLESFQHRFVRPMLDKSEEPMPILKALVRPFILRRTKDMVLQELPPRNECIVDVTLCNEEKRAYNTLALRSLEKIEMAAKNSGKSRVCIFAEMTRLRRFCCHPTLARQDLDIPSSKTATFLQMAEELRQQGHRALVFSQFTSYLKLLGKELDAKGISYHYLDGSTPAEERTRRVASFQQGQTPLFLISLKAGGLGLNLTAANHVIHMDPWWNPAVEDQASDRAHRLGQEHAVTVHRLVNKGTLEEHILALHHKKRSMAADVLDGTDTTARISEQELLSLFRPCA